MFKDKKYTNIFIIILASILFMWSLDNLDKVGLGLSRLFSILKPFIFAIIISFLFNGPMMFIENNLKKIDFIDKKVSKSSLRVISYVLTLIFIILIIGIISFIIVPELINTSKQLANDIPKYWENLSVRLEGSPIFAEIMEKIDLEDISSKVYSFFKEGLVGWIGSSFIVVSSIVSSVVTFFISFMLSIYILMQKEELLINLQKVIYALSSEKISGRLLYIGNLTRTTFSHFITGQVTESTILGLIFLVVMLVLKLPYALMISIVIAITSLIPTVGSFIGCGFGLLLITVEDYRKSLLFLVVFLIIQQIEGNLIYPKVVGKASGLSSLWVLVAITLGGSLMGIVGIIVFVPLFSVLQTLMKEFIDKRLEKKEIIIDKNLSN